MKGALKNGSKLVYQLKNNDFTKISWVQGCFSLHTTSVRNDPPSQTTTVYHEPADDSVLTTTH